MTNETTQTDYAVGTLRYTKKSLGALFFWLLWGDLCYMLMESVVPSILPLQLQHLQASNTTIGLFMTSIPLLMAALLNPTISTKSDRYRSPYGRRIPFILATLPFLVLALIGLGYTEQIAGWYSAHFGVAHAESQKTVAIATIAVFLIAFLFFNSFVGAVFWYLFNDVVPENLLARFMSLFRLISMISASAYNFFIFRYAGTHAGAIFTGIGALYFFGFGLMCFKVKEGQYPPPPQNVDGQSGAVSAIKSYIVECLSLPHYWYLFLASMCISFSNCANAFQLFFFQSTGLGLKQIGYVNGSVNIAIAVLIPISGLLADKFHPVRIVIIGYVATLLVVIPTSMVFLFWHPDPKLAFVFWMAFSLALSAPAQALTGVFDPPMLMVTFPRSRYGQFCSANAMLRSVAGIAGGALTGGFFDLATHYMGHKDVYRLIPVWQFITLTPVLIVLVLLYRSWKRHGGDHHYVPPVPGERIQERADDELVEAELSA